MRKWDVYKFDFWLLIDETPTKWRPLAFKEPRHEMTETHVFGMSCMLSPDSTHAVQVNCFSKTECHQDTALRCIYGGFTFNGSQSKTTQIWTVTVSGENTPLDFYPKLS